LKELIFKNLGSFLINEKNIKMKFFIEHLHNKPHVDIIELSTLIVMGEKCLISHPLESFKIGKDGIKKVHP
jgi:hypothetical protein